MLDKLAAPYRWIHEQAGETVAGLAGMALVTALYAAVLLVVLGLAVRAVAALVRASGGSDSGTR